VFAISVKPNWTARTFKSGAQELSDYSVYSSDYVRVCTCDDDDPILLEETTDDNVTGLDAGATAGVVVKKKMSKKKSNLNSAEVKNKRI